MVAEHGNHGECGARRRCAGDDDIGAILAVVADLGGEARRFYPISQNGEVPKFLRCPGRFSGFASDAGLRARRVRREWVMLGAAKLGFPGRCARMMAPPIPAVAIPGSVNDVLL